MTLSSERTRLENYGCLYFPKSGQEINLEKSINNVYV